MSEQLKSPPLVEVILEMRWRVGPASQPDQTSGRRGAVSVVPAEMTVDPSYDLLVGRMFDRLSAIYPFHERLPSAMVPAEMVPFLVQHRFRRAQGSWPLVQVGPGIVTLNDTAKVFR